MKDQIQGNKPAKKITIEALQNVGFAALKNHYNFPKEVSLRKFYKAFKRIVRENMQFEPNDFEAKILISFIAIAAQMNQIKNNIGDSLNVSNLFDSISETIVENKEGKNE